MLLVEALNRFESFLVPLLDRNLHLVVTQALQNVDESLQGRVTLLVKSAVSEELIQGVLLP